MSADASRTIDPEATRESILDAATALFVDRGYEGVSMSAIAKDAGVTKSLIHHHFGTKAELYRDVFGDSARRGQFIPLSPGHLAALGGAQSHATKSLLAMGYLTQEGHRLTLHIGSGHYVGRPADNVWPAGLPKHT